MQLESVGQVLATRTFELRDGDSFREVRVLIGMPRRIPEEVDFYCPYQIVGLLDETVRYVEGVDEAQAIYLAMEAAGTALSTTPEVRTGRLLWYGEPFLGLPVRERRPELRLVASS